ncbi:spore germination lipoprotein GerD [Mesobacillus zeae]|uniref:Spore gernimation protein GerD n=1 Tax=Mesobacillus zeae TaxID=1917180 RepID=A0A398BEL7_9BACI|nr:spore germination lipoprotein GerD [Mesobacillus zeae]RID86026.1 spore gernimation protein GerD [Mesobacillus zeae]
MWKKASKFLPVLGLCMLAGCAPAESGGEQMDYEMTKKMVVDILKTDDGKKAIQEVMSDDGMKEKLVLDQSVVSDTVQNTLVSDKGTQFWNKQFKDPKFAQSMAKSMKTENEQLLKDMMKDPEYRGMMIEVMKDPELEKELVEVLKSKEYRKHMQSVVTETFDSPLFKAKVQDMLIKAASEVPDKQQGGSGDSGGGGGGGESGGGPSPGGP